MSFGLLNLYLRLVILASGGRYVLPDTGVLELRSEHPRVMVGVIARNTAHTLPNFFGYLENIDYPKDRMNIWIRTAPSVDTTQSLVAQWAENVRKVYASVNYSHDDKYRLIEGKDPFWITDDWYEGLAQLRQEGLDHARLLDMDYLLWVDCDNYLVNNQTLRIIMDQQKPLIAPMLECGMGMAFSNFWYGQDERGYYKRTPEYLPTYGRKRVGCFQVPVIFGTVLVNLRDPKCKNLAYSPPPEGFRGPVDDTIQFAFSAKKEGAGMFVLNSEVFGFIMRPEHLTTAELHERHFLHFKLKTLVNHPPVLTSQYLSLPKPVKDTVGLNRIYMISLERRPERRNRMLACLNELRLDVTLFNAIDGRRLNDSYVDSLGIHYMPGWKDPWGERPMTLGEVGCFLSHYFIWQQMVEEDLQEVLVLEDDIDFEKDFRENLQKVLSEARELTPNWDLM